VNISTLQSVILGNCLTFPPCQRNLIPEAIPTLKTDHCSSSHGQHPYLYYSGTRLHGGHLNCTCLETLKNVFTGMEIVGQLLWRQNPSKRLHCNYQVNNCNDHFDNCNYHFDNCNYHFDHCNYHVDHCNYRAIIKNIK
jgi:hypothetical protein